MAPEKQLKEGMPIKQKLTIGIFIVIVLVLIWQVKGFFGGSPVSPPSATMQPAPTAKLSATAPGTGGAAPVMSAAPPGGTAPGAPSMTAAPAAPAASPVPVQAPIPDEVPTPAATVEATLKQEQSNQQKYLTKLNELEELKVQQSIAETNQAIATAKLATVTAEKDITDLLTKPAVPIAAPAPPVPASTYANQLNAPEGGAGTPTTATPQPTQAAPTVAPEPYTLISVTMQLNKWSAVLGGEGKLYNVSVGDVLPLDNSVVYRINRNAVILKKDHKARKISLVPSI